MKASVRGQRLRVRLVTTVVAAVAALLGTFLVAKPAAAATGWDRCPTATFCVFEHANGEGRFAYFSTGSQNLTWPIGGFNFNDQISSVWNRSPHFIFCGYYHINYTSPAIVVNTYSPRVNLGGALNDSLSSINKSSLPIGYGGFCNGAYIVR